MIAQPEMSVVAKSAIDWSQWLPDFTVAIITGLFVSFAVLLAQAVSDRRRRRFEAEKEWAIARRAIQRAMSRDWTWVINRYADFGSRVRALEKIAKTTPLTAWLGLVQDPALQGTLDLLSAIDTAKATAEKYRLKTRTAIAEDADRMIPEEAYIRAFGARIYYDMPTEPWIDSSPIVRETVKAGVDRMMQRAEVTEAYDKHQIATSYLLDTGRALEDALRATTPTATLKSRGVRGPARS